MSILECKNEELEQYGRRCCLRIEGVPSVENESSDDILGKVKSLITGSGCEIPVVVIDRAHRIDKGCKDRTRNVPCKSIIVRFSIFRHNIVLSEQKQTKKCESSVRSHKEKVQDIYRCHCLCESMQKC